MRARATTKHQPIQLVVFASFGNGSEVGTFQGFDGSRQEFEPPTTPVGGEFFAGDGDGVVTHLKQWW